MAEVYSVPLSELVKEFNLEVLHMPSHEVMVTCKDVNRPGLELAGYMDYFDGSRIQIMGKIEISYLEKGATLEDGYITKPSEIELDADKKSGYITLVEGKYHQIKRMLESVNNKITYLERVTFGPLCLDENLSRGEWRFLSKEEIERLEEHR